MPQLCFFPSFFMQIKNTAIAAFALSIALVGCTASTTGQVSTDESASAAAEGTVAGDWQQTNGAWQDADGNWRKMEGGQLMTSVDGNAWAVAEGSAFKGDNGMWYQWDSAGTLMSSTDGLNWFVVDSKEWVANGMTYMMDADGKIMMKHSVDTGVTMSVSAVASEGMTEGAPQ
jgi:hypothetical protein